MGGALLLLNLLFPFPEMKPASEKQRKKDEQFWLPVEWAWTTNEGGPKVDAYLLVGDLVEDVLGALALWRSYAVMSLSRAAVKV